MIFAPLKMEEMSLNPRIVLFYDVLNENEILLLKTLATPELERSFVDEDGEAVTAHYR